MHLICCFLICRCSSSNTNLWTLLLLGSQINMMFRLYERGEFVNVQVLTARRKIPWQRQSKPRWNSLKQVEPQKKSCRRKGLLFFAVVLAIQFTPSSDSSYSRCSSIRLLNAAIRLNPLRFLSRQHYRRLGSSPRRALLISF